MSDIPLMRYHGGKFRLAPWVISHFPRDHVVYIEPFGGAGSVLFAKPPSEREVYNDLSGDIVNVFRVVRDRTGVRALARDLYMTPYARAEFDLAYEPTADPVERARRTIMRAQMGFGSAGATKTSTGFRSDARRKYGTGADHWHGYPEHLLEFHDRLQGVIIENKPAADLIEQQDGPDALFYIDPPYMHSTRSSRNDAPRAVYHHEMSDADHAALLELVKNCAGSVVLSGYDNDLYNDNLSCWTKFQKKSRISGGRGTAVKVESLWINPKCAEARGQKGFFDDH